MMGKDKYICPCFKVTKDDIKKAIEEGADSFKKVKKPRIWPRDAATVNARLRSIRKSGWVRSNNIQFKSVSSHRNISWGTRFLRIRPSQMQAEIILKKWTFPKHFPISCNSTTDGISCGFHISITNVANPHGFT